MPEAERPATDTETSALRNKLAAEARELLTGDISEDAVRNFQLQRGVLASWENLMRETIEVHDHDGTNHHDHVYVDTP
jgi:hypothetical protein